MKKICEGCKAEIVYGYVASLDGEEQEFICDECANKWNAGYNADGSYEPPAFFPIRQPGHC
jgi:hypothetical protein